MTRPVHSRSVLEPASSTASDAAGRPGSDTDGTHAAPKSGDVSGAGVESTPGAVIVCGLNHLGLRTVQELRLRDEHVVLIAGQADEAIDPDELGGIHVVRGDQRHERVLRAAGVPTAAAIVLTTDDDLGNLHAASRRTRSIRRSGS